VVSVSGADLIDVHEMSILYQIGSPSMDILHSRISLSDHLMDRHEQTGNLTSSETVMDVHITHRTSRQNGPNLHIFHF
jgi:hypothetical protein